MAAHIGPHPVVVDCGGTKRTICAACFPIAKEYGVTFLGGHPMAGTQYSGFKNAKATMYHGAPMVIVPPDFDDVLLFDHVKQLLQPAGFARFSFTTAEAHDEMIAFTSQMAHVVSNAYIKSPTASQHKGFSAGSYKDMTRVAWLSPEMWAELFLENKDNLLHELDMFMTHLGEYRDAMARDGENAANEAHSYVDNSNRNDITAIKVIHDAQNVYFYAETAEKITEYNGTDANWMNLFISAGDTENSFAGFNYVVNRKPGGRRHFGGEKRGRIQLDGNGQSGILCFGQ